MLGMLLPAAISAAAQIGSLAISHKRTEEDRWQNYYLNEAAAGAADQRTRRLYQDLQSPQALLEQYRQAGLSPSLMMGAGGGTSGQVQQGAQGMGGNGLQTQMFGLNAMEAANIGLMNAQANKAQAEADTLQGKTPQGEANIAETWSKAGLNDAAKMYTAAQTTMQKINNYIADETKAFVISRIKSEASIAAENATKAYWDAENAGLEWQFNVQTFEKRVQKVAKEVTELAARAALEYSQQKLNDVERAAIKDYVVQGYMNALAHISSAADYGRYVEAYCENLPKQLEMRGKELNVDKWRIGVNAFTDLIRSAAYVFGAEAMAGETTGTVEEVTEEFNHGYPTTTGRKTKTYTGKRGFGSKW